MYCDALTIAAVADELRRELLGGRIQRVLLIDRLTIGLEVYAHHQRHYLLISAQPKDGGRIHLVQGKLRRGVASPSPFILRLRKCARASHLIDIQQPSLERLLQFTLKGAGSIVTLIAEVMGWRSNIVLLEEDGTILECIKRVPASQNRYRVLLPGYLYVPPPTQQKVELSTLTPTRLAKVLERQGQTCPLWQNLVATLRGVSPLLAREAVYRVSGDAECQEADIEAVLSQLGELFQLARTGQWQPTVAVQEGKVIAYAPYVLTQYQRYEARASISEAMTAYYAQRLGADAYAAAKSALQNILAKQRDRQLRKKEALFRAYPASEMLDALRRSGELLLTYAHQVSSGQSELVVSLSDVEPPMRIVLDPAKSAIENAQEYFKLYEKAKNAAIEVPRLLAEVEAELAYLDQLSTELALAEDQPGIAAVESALAEAGYLPTSKKKVKHPPGPLRLLSEEGFVILVGRNSQQNEEVTFARGKKHDIWLHAQGIPGAHVLIQTEGRDVPEATLRRAAQLAAYYSAARQEELVPVDYTLRKHVRRLKGGKSGQVIYKAQKTLTVRPTK